MLTRCEFQGDVPMLKTVREKLNNRLWQYYKHLYWNDAIMPFDKEVILDHFAIIELPSAYSGINYLANIFNLLGYERRGSGYLEAKNNDFIWMAANDCEEKTVHQSLPQLVLADFRLADLSQAVQDIVNHYTRDIMPLNYQELETLIERIAHGHMDAMEAIVHMLFEYLTYRTWGMPTLDEYEVVRRENELLAWVLVFGRTINHYGISVYATGEHLNLQHFINSMVQGRRVKLNKIGGLIKGSPVLGIEQAATQGADVHLALQDGALQLPGPFIEFVWRYPVQENPMLWKDYYTDFIPANAGDIIESIYTEDIKHNIS